MEAQKESRVTQAEDVSNMEERSVKTNGELAGKLPLNWNTQPLCIINIVEIIERAKKYAH